MPVLAIDVLSQAIARMHLRSPCQADLQTVLQKYMDMCTANERICRTPIPMPYSRCGASASARLEFASEVTSLSVVVTYWCSHTSTCLAAPCSCLPQLRSLLICHQANIAGACSRTVPLSTDRQRRMTYRHTTRFVIAYVVFLPLGLWRHCSYWTLAIAPLITFMLAGIENIGVQVRRSTLSAATALLCRSAVRPIRCVACALP